MSANCRSAIHIYCRSGICCERTFHACVFLSHRTDSVAGPAVTSKWRQFHLLIAASVREEETHHPTKIERAKKASGTIERGVRPAKGSSCQKRSPRLCEDCSERPPTVGGLEYRSTRFPGRCYRRKSRVLRQIRCSDRRYFHESLPSRYL